MADTLHFDGDSVIGLDLQHALGLLGDVKALMQAAAALKAQPDLVTHLCAIASNLMDDAGTILDAFNHGEVVA